METINKLISEKEIQKKVKELAHQIKNDYNEEITVICVLKGAFTFTADLVRAIDSNLKIEFIKVSSYGNNTESTGKVNLGYSTLENVKGKKLLIVEDIVDTGYTLKALAEYYYSLSPKSIKICTLLDKPERRKVEINVDYVGFTIPDQFVVGYGIDYAEKYRNLPYIGVVHLDDK